MTALHLTKRKRSSDAVSEAGTCGTEQTDGSTPRRDVDEKSQMLAQKREEHAEAKLKLEEQIKQTQEQRQHTAAQLEQLEGCECSRDMLGISDLRAQLQAYEQQEQEALAQQELLKQQFEADVARILGIPAEQQPRKLAEAVQEQEQLQEVQVQQLVVEQQLAGREFAVTDSSKHQNKKARMDRMSQVWNWLQGSTAPDAAAAATNGAPPGPAGAVGFAESAAAGAAGADKAEPAHVGSDTAGEVQQQQQSQMQSQQQQPSGKQSEQSSQPGGSSQQQEQGEEEQQQQQQKQQEGEQSHLQQQQEGQQADATTGRQPVVELGS